MTEARRCVGKHCHDGPPILLDGVEQPAPRLVPTDGSTGLLCRRHYHALEQHLAELPAKTTELEQVLAGGRGGGGQRRGTPELPVPLNVAAYDHLQEVGGTLVSWALLVREERGLRGPDSDTPARLAPWLLGQLDWVAGQPWVDDFADEIRDLTVKADQITGRKPLRNRLEPPCPRCLARELGRWDGASEVDCGACGASWDERLYPAMVRLVLDDSGGCVTAEEAAGELGVTVGALRMLVNRGQVRKLGTVDGTARYSASDVERVKRIREAS